MIGFESGNSHFNELEGLKVSIQGCRVCLCESVHLRQVTTIYFYSKNRGHKVMILHKSTPIDCCGFCVKSEEPQSHATKCAWQLRKWCKCQFTNITSTETLIIGYCSKSMTSMTTRHDNTKEIGASEWKWFWKWKKETGELWEYYVNFVEFGQMLSQLLMRACCTHRAVSQSKCESTETSHCNNKQQTTTKVIDYLWEFIKSERSFPFFQVSSQDRTSQTCFIVVNFS